MTISGQYGDSNHTAETIAFLRANSPTFEVAFEAMSQSAIDGNGFEIRPQAAISGGTYADRVITFDQSSTIRLSNGTVLYPALTLAHEIGHAADAIFGIVDSQYPFGLGTLDPKSPEADFGGKGYAVTVPQVEAYAVRFANQVSAEVMHNAKVDIGHMDNYLQELNDKDQKPCVGAMHPKGQ